MAVHFAEEREQIVMDFLQKQGSIHIGDVTDMLQISPSTARLLLQKMQDKGLLRRTHGGAIPIRKAADQSSIPSENAAVHAEQTASGQASYFSGSAATGGQPFPEREPAAMTGGAETQTEMISAADLFSIKVRTFFGQIQNMEKKLRIAAAAASTVHDEDYISLGAGTTTWLMATMLHGKKDLTVVTDSIPIACELIKDEGITLYLCGGWIMPRIAACRGITAESFFNDMKVDKSYNGADSVNAEIGVISKDYDPRTERAICHSGKECYILADSSKFSTRSYMDKVLSIREIHHIISDSSLPDHYVEALRKNGIDVILAEE